MGAFLSSGRAIDIILAIVALEAAGLLVIHGPRRAVTILFALLPGVCLLLAVRSALTGADWIWTAAWLAASFPSHLIDLWRRQP